MITVKELAKLNSKKVREALEGLPVLDIFILIHFSEPEKVSRWADDDEFVTWLGPLLRQNQDIKNHVVSKHDEYINQETQCRCREEELLK